MKHLAKTRAGSSCVLSSCGRVMDFPGQRKPGTAAAEVGDTLAASA